MKTLLSTALFAVLLASQTAQAAQFETTETVVHDTTTTLEIALDDTTVLCSAADYGALFLKILIPELADITLLDHQNIGAGAPCVAAGPCFEENMPADILTEDPVESVDIQVQAVRRDSIDHDAETCNTTLIENVYVDVRGVEFTHVRTASLGVRPYGDCVTSSGEPADPVVPSPVSSGGDLPADQPGGLPVADTGGCAAGGSSSGFAGAFLLLGAALTLRRRRR